MAKVKLPLILFGLLALIQLAVPIWMIADREYTLHYGEVHRFKTAPVDPYDIFRGRYVALDIESSRAKRPKMGKVTKGQYVYVALSRDEEGMSHFGQAYLMPPDVPYLYLQVRYVQDKFLELELPFDRYYMEETLAPEAEMAYRDANRDGDASAYISVRVYRGKGVLEALYIENKPIEAYLNNANTVSVSDT